MPDDAPAPAGPTPPGNAVLAAMLDRLYVALMRGPGLNCRPHNSRQRIDLTDLIALEDGPAPDMLRKLLGEPQAVRIHANVPQPPGWGDLAWFKRRAPKVDFDPDDSPQDPAATTPAPSQDAPPQDPEDPGVAAYRRQRALLAKLRNLSDDARVYQQDTGVHALYLGYPILSVPPGCVGGGGSRRILAPLAFVPVTLTLKQGGRPGVELQCRAADADRVVPNPALLAWVERETGCRAPDELFEDDDGNQPWREIAELIRLVTRALDLPGVDPEALTDPLRFTLEPCPKADALPRTPAVLGSAVLGLFPASNQGLLRDTREMINEADRLTGPVQSFIKAGVSLDTDAAAGQRAEQPHSQDTDHAGIHTPDFSLHRFVALADPCQQRAVELARSHAGLVLHGPPGTGKSQTITNIIGDHLARGQRVLFVCDKRTALDVVAHRLAALGLDSLCALVHDPQRDQRDLYLGIRARLDQLTDADTHPRAESRLSRLDDEQRTLHRELAELYEALMPPVSAVGGLASGSFHELIGQWLRLDAAPLPEAQLRNLTVDDLDRHRRATDLVLERGAALGYGTHPWAAAADGPLERYLAQPADELRRRLASCVEDARAADATADARIPPFGPDEALDAQSRRRAALLEHLRWLDAHPDPQRAAHAAGLDADVLPKLADKLGDARPWRDTLDQGPLDAELWLSVRDAVPSPRAINEQLGALDRYLAVSGKWYGFLALGAKRNAGKTLRGYGLQRNADDARRLQRFLAAVRARILLTAAAETLTGVNPGPALWPDETLTATFAQYDRLLPARRLADADAHLGEPLRAALTDDAARSRLLAGLERSPARGAALLALETSLQKTELLNETWRRTATAAFRAYKPGAEPDGASAPPPNARPTQGRPATPTLQRLADRFDDLETVLRIGDGLASLPVELREAVLDLLDSGADPQRGHDALLKRVLQHTLAARVAGQPALGRLDPAAIDHTFTRFAEVEAEKRKLTRDAILHRWTRLQQQRLLVGTGSKLNALGASVRQRLFVRGQRAMRLRQVIEVGRNAGYEDGGGDPIFDLCPVWLASPETVAQCFPRDTIFDTVVFDEASQCRLEEALPVLTRARRVVIAGDPKQLPPTRFFEASIATSDDAPLGTEDDLFEAQQTEVEDLLAAALNLDVQESYLDVHYRSRNADLIEFSNEQFYHGRLQAIPGHPRSRSRYAPLTLHRADGVYEDRVNPAEAERVVQLVDGLLRRAEPPSIGIACFNLAQRDLIAERLDDLAMQDDGFARRLEAARNRDGDASFEGLFVKNLENVQGDERDHIIISTTYGPNAQGRFYRRFGPLAMPGGGRRLNVLVTRARHEIHLVTSIPQSQYRSFEPVPEGQTPSGAWLLFAYLRYAEDLATAYQQNHRVLEAAQQQPAAARLLATKARSRFAEAMAGRLAAECRVGSDVYWGNDGFCVDLALHHPRDPDAVTVGVLCDFSRFGHATDPVLWDLYRTGILRWQGWALHRLWSPTFFRDPARSTQQLLAEAQREAAKSPAPST